MADMDTETTGRRIPLDQVRRPVTATGGDHPDMPDGAATMALSQEFPRLPLPDDLVDWMGFVRRHWMLMLVVWFVVMVMVGIALYLWPRQFESTAKFLVKNARQDLVVGPGESATAAYREQLSETVMNTELELLRSRDVMARVVSELRLDKALIDEGVAPEVAAERAVRGLGGRLSAGTLRKTNLIQVSYMSRNPELAAAIVQHVANAYLAAHLAVHSSPGTYQMFQQQAGDAESELRKAEGELAALARSANLVMLEEQKQEALRGVQAIEAQLSAVATEASEQGERARMAEVHMAQTPERVPTTLRNIPNQSSVERLHTMIVELRNKRTEALTKFNPTDRLVLELEQQIADTTSALERAQQMSASEQSTGINPAWQQLDGERTKARLQLAGLESKAHEMKRELTAQRQRLLGIVEAGPRYEQLVRNVADAKSKYELFAKRQEEARIADVLDHQRISNVVLAQAPVVSHVPSKPNVRLGMVAGMIVAGMTALGGAFVRDFFAVELSRRRRPAHQVSVVGIEPATAEWR